MAKAAGHMPTGGKAPKGALPPYPPVGVTTVYSGREQCAWRGVGRQRRAGWV